MDTSTSARGTDSRTLDGIVINLRLAEGAKECLVKKTTGECDWVPFDRVRQECILAYYKSLVPNPSQKTKDKLLLQRLAKVEDTVKEHLLSTYLTPSGLEIPPLQLDEIREKLKKLKPEFDPAVDSDYADYVADLRRSVVAGDLIKKREAEHSRLRERLESMQSEAKGAPFQIENKVDLDGLEEFGYTEKLVPTDSVDLDILAKAEGCNCEGDCRTQCTCVRSAEPYYQDGLLQRYDVDVFECNERCRCFGSSCTNSVVSRATGCPYPLVLFKTFNGCGWGVRTTKTIVKGKYVLTYAGEVITYEEKNKRNSRWLFGTDSCESCVDGCLSIDALYKGNLSRYVNHSCDPNLIVVKVFSDYADRLPNIVFFASHDIHPGEELCIDYGPYYKLACNCGRRPCIGSNGVFDDNNN